MQMRFPNPNLLAYIAMADAYCAAVEYVKLPQHVALVQQALRFEKYLQHPTHGLAPGQYTDDGEMNCANAQALLNFGERPTARNFADEYVREFKSGGERRGYAQGFYAVLQQVRNGEELLRMTKSHGNASTKNGACMRAPVLGVLPTVRAVLDAATTQARITHDSSVGRFSARAVALMAHYAMHHHGPLEQAGDFCVDNLPDEDLHFMSILFEPWEGPVKSDPSRGLSVGVATVHAAHHIIETEMLKPVPSLMGMLEQVIQLGGDTDTVAAVVWGIASSRFQDETLPEFLFQDLEGGNQATGLPYLQHLGTTLMQTFNKLS